MDGAHSLGMYDLNIPELGVDWYVGCCHKWLMSSKGVGYVWAKEEHHKMLRSMNISKRHNEGFPTSFDEVGTKDYTPWLTVEDGINSLKGLDEDANIYGHDLAVWAGDYVAGRFGVDNVVPESMVTFMTTVELPAKLQ